MHPRTGKGPGLPNKAAGSPVSSYPLMLPGIHSLRAEPHLLAKKKKEPKELIIRDGTLRR